MRCFRGKGTRNQPSCLPRLCCTMIQTSRRSHQPAPSDAPNGTSFSSFYSITRCLQNPHGASESAHALLASILFFHTHFTRTHCPPSELVEEERPALSLSFCLPIKLFLMVFPNRLSDCSFRSPCSTVSRNLQHEHNKQHADLLEHVHRKRTGISGPQNHKIIQPIRSSSTNSFG